MSEKLENNGGIFILKEPFRTIDGFTKELQKESWYKNLSIEQKDNIKRKYIEKFELEKKLELKKSELKSKGVSADIIKKGLEKIVFEYENAEKNEKQNDFEERLSILSRKIDELQKQLYEIELEIAKPGLSKYFKENLENEKDKTFKEFSEKVDLQNLKSGEIYTLKAKGYDLSRLFLQTENKNETVSKENMKIGDKFKVYFGGNKNLNAKIGAGDLLPISEIDKVKINGVIGTRREKPRPGYYSKSGRYLEVFDNYEIEILSKKPLEKDFIEKYKKAAKERYSTIRSEELEKNISYELIKNKGNKFEFDLQFIEDLGILKTLFEKNKNLNFSEKNGKIILESKKGGKLSDIIGDLKHKKGKKHFLPLVKKVSEIFPNVSTKQLINLIDHENGDWAPLKSVPGGTAYGLGQMIDDTWDRFGKGLERSNPEHQLIATCKYLEHIMKTKNCNYEVAMAYYNTGEGILYITYEDLQDYIAKNKPIVNKIPKGIKITRRVYFIGAIAYYNNISYEQAMKKFA